MVFLHRLKSLPFEKTKNFNIDLVNSIIDEDAVLNEEKAG